MFCLSKSVMLKIARLSIAFMKHFKVKNLINEKVKIG